MRQLTRWVTAEEADAGSTCSYAFCKFRSGMRFARRRALSIMPVLTEQAVKCTGLIEYRQVHIALFRPRPIRPLGVSSATAPCTYPVSYAVGWQRVIIPRDRSRIGRTARQAPVFISPHTAITPPTGRDFALVLAELTLGTIRSGRGQSGKAKPLAASPVNFPKFYQAVTVSFANTFSTKRQYLRYFLGTLAALFARGHSKPYRLVKTLNVGAGPLLFPASECGPQCPCSRLNVRRPNHYVRFFPTRPCATVYKVHIDPFCSQLIRQLGQCADPVRQVYQ